MHESRSSRARILRTTSQAGTWRHNVQFRPSNRCGGDWRREKRPRDKTYQEARRAPVADDMFGVGATSPNAWWTGQMSSEMRAHARGKWRGGIDGCLCDGGPASAELQYQKAARSGMRLRAGGAGAWSHSIN